jgi:hypothetical protein
MDIATANTSKVDVAFIVLNVAVLFLLVLSRQARWRKPLGINPYSLPGIDHACYPCLPREQCAGGDPPTTLLLDSLLYALDLQ